MMSLFGAFWDKDPNPVGAEQFGNNLGLFYNLNWYPKGVLHIGAWDAWEAKQYAEYCANNCIFVEANIDTFARFRNEVEKFGQKIYNYAAWDEDDLELKLYCPEHNLDSSSLIEKIGTEKKTISIRIETLFDRENLSFENYDLLNIDTEGAELQVLKGFGDNLFHFTYIIIEVSDLGSDFDKSINAYLESKSFYLVRESTHHQSSVTGKFFCDKLYKQTK